MHPVSDQTTLHGTRRRYDLPGIHGLALAGYAGRRTGRARRLLPLTSLDEFLDLLASGPIAYVRPDLCLTGLTQGKKIAALAEAWHVGVIPHNWLSPVSTAACIQLGAAAGASATPSGPPASGRSPPPAAVSTRPPTRWLVRGHRVRGRFGRRFPILPDPKCEQRRRSLRYAEGRSHGKAVAGGAR